MKLTNIQLTNFKNYERLTQAFSGEITCFVGENGEGKTNLLDAIFYLCIGKSYFHSVEKYNRRYQQNFLRIEGSFTKNDKKEDVVIVSQKGLPKKIEKNKLPYERVSSHLGCFPICFIAPDDSVILQGGSENRRKFLDTTLSQMSKSYLLQLIEYNKILQQRNALLKTDKIDESLLETYNRQLAPLGNSIHGVREAYVIELAKRIQLIYSVISQEKELVTCSYQTQLDRDNFFSLLQENEKKDILFQRTTVGTHKDDLAFLIDGNILKKVGSQGQQKTALLALKLAEFELLAEYTKQAPLLLLDDIFDKLDAQRVTQLFAYITNNYNSQLFITDTDGRRLKQLLEKFNCKFELFTVKENQLHNYAQE